MRSLGAGAANQREDRQALPRYSRGRCSPNGLILRLDGRGGGWRVAIVDSLDELNDSGANALLKILEEPPRRALLLLVSHAPGRVLPTIRSRARPLMLRPLSVENTARAVAQALERNVEEPELRAAANVADGSVARALTLLEGSALALRQRVLDLLGQL